MTNPLIENQRVSLQLIQTYSLIFVGLALLFSFVESTLSLFFISFTMMASIMAIIQCLWILYGYYNKTSEPEKHRKGAQLVCMTPFIVLMGVPISLLFESQLN